MSVAKKIFSIAFFLISLVILFIDYFFILLSIDFLLPTFFEITIVVLPLVITITAFLTIIKSFEVKFITKKYVIAICLLILLLPCTYFGLIMSKNYSISLFNEERWTKKPDERVYMVDNLLYKYKLKGMTKDEVKKLLGEPTKTEYFKTPSNFVYYLGPERGFIRIDSEWLTIDFDDKGMVNSFGIARD